MRFALFGVTHAETLAAIFGLVAGMLVFSSGYIVGAQTHPPEQSCVVADTANPDAKAKDGLIPKQVKTVPIRKGTSP
jgi:hypothetical protein